MKRKLLILCFILCAAVLWIPTALGADSGSVPGIWVKAQNLRENTLSFTLELSAPEEGDCVYVAAYAESGRMKRTEIYPAAASVSVTFDGVTDADSVKAMWVKPNLYPVGVVRVYPADSVSAASYTAQTYEEYAGQLADMLQDFSPFHAGAVPESADEYVFARLIVHTDRELPSFINEHLARKVSDMEGNTVLQFDSAAAAKTCDEKLQDWFSKEEDSGEYVVPDTLMWAVPTETAGGTAAESSLSWGVATIHADAYAASLRERGITPTVTVAVVDSGGDSGHACFNGRIVPGHDYVDNDNDPKDESLHGTHVAGTVADCTSGLDNIKIMPIRVLDATGYGSSLGVGLGIRYAADHDADVINLSLGGAHSPSIDKAVAYAISKNVIVVAAAGNEKAPARNSCPAHIPECITVSAVDSGLKPANFTNFGSGVDLAAPGVGINSAVPGGGYQSLNGTSMAAPHVSACAAMLRAEFPSLTPAQVEERLLSTLQKPDDWNPNYGAGALDMASFVKETPSNLYAVLYQDGELVFQNSATTDSDRKTAQTYALKSSDGMTQEYTGWHAKKDIIQKVTFKEKVRPQSTALWFSDCSSLTSVQGLDNLDLSGVTDMSQMFSGCGALTELNLSGLDTGKIEDMSKLFFDCGNLKTLDLRGWNTSAVVSMEDMFKDCKKLETIYVSDSFTVSQVSDGKTMFENCEALRGVMGTVFHPLRIDKTYARIDGGTSQPGYFTDKDFPAPSGTLYAILYDNGELAFQSSLTPQTGKTALKSYQTDGGGYDGGAYTAWYKERKQIQSVSFETDIYPSSTALWFYGFEKLTGLKNMERLHTDYVTDMSQMFSYCSSLQFLDLRSFAVAKTTNTNTMFFRCSALTTIRVSGTFTVEQITDSKSMFDGCTSLVGGTGTKYDPAHTDKEYARIDGGVNAPGYFSAG